MKNDLSSIKTGDSAVVERIASDGLLNRRLLDLGLVPGTKITCLYSAPSGDPRAYLVRGTVIALRKIDAKQILLC